MNGSDTFDHDAFSVEFASAISEFSTPVSAGHHALSMQGRRLTQAQAHKLMANDDEDDHVPQLTIVGKHSGGHQGARTSALKMYTPPPSHGTNGDGVYSTELPGSCYSHEGTMISPAATPILGSDGHHHPGDYYSGKITFKKKIKTNKISNTKFYLEESNS